MKQKNGVNPSVKQEKNAEWRRADDIEEFENTLPQRGVEFEIKKKRSKEEML